MFEIAYNIKLKQVLVFEKLKASTKCPICSIIFACYMVQDMVIFVQLIICVICALQQLVHIQFELFLIFMYAQT